METNQNSSKIEALEKIAKELSNKKNEEMRENSGNFTTTDRLVVFLYLIMRDKIPTGELDTIISSIENSSGVTRLTNGWLGRYAVNLANRLMGTEFRVS